MPSADLLALLAVQDLDVSIDQHRHRRRNLPERAELKASEAEVTSIDSERAATERERDEIAAREAALEEDLAATERRAAAVRKRLYGGEVSASRELQAMAADVEHLQERASQLEDEGLVLLEEREPVDARLSQLEARLMALAAHRAEIRGRLEVAEASVDSELAALEARRARASEGVPADLLATYERIRVRLGGVGAARLVGNHCDGCHLVLSAVELDRIRHLPDGEVLTCEQCSRILVPTGSSA